MDVLQRQPGGWIAVFIMPKTAVEGIIAIIADNKTFADASCIRDTSAPSSNTLNSAG